MRTRGAAGLALGVALGVAVLAFVLRERARDSVERVDVSAMPDAARMPDGLELGESAGGSPVVRSDESTAPQRTPAAAALIDPSAGPWLSVRARADGATIPNATVYWNDASDPAFEQTLRALGPDHARGPWPTGTRRFTTDADGRVQLPSSRQRVRVVMFAPGRVGSHDFRADWSAVITASMMDVFYARIVSAAGEIVSDATVSCSAGIGDVEADAAGRVAFEFWPSRISRTTAKLELVVRRPLAQDMSFDFPADVRCESWKVLTVPRGGELRVNVPDAAAVLGKSSGTLHVQRHTRFAGDRPHLPSVDVPFVAGTGVVTDVPFDLEFDVSVQLDGVAGWLTARLPGPHHNSDGAIVHELRCVELAFGVVQLVDAGARPIANMQVVADINAKWPTVCGKATTDSNGRLYVLLEDHFAPGEPRRLWLDVPGKFTIGMELPGAFVPGVIDLGTVRLETDESADKSPRPRAPGGRNVK